MYDVTSVGSFSNLREWVLAVESHASDDVHTILVGNKSDRPDRMVESNQGEEYAKHHDMPFLETSAKNSHNIDSLFEQVARTLQEAHAEKQLKNSTHSTGTSAGGASVTLTQTSVKGGGKCCHH